MTSTKFSERLVLKNRQFWKKHIIFEDDKVFRDKDTTSESTSTTKKIDIKSGDTLFHKLISDCLLIVFWRKRGMLFKEIREIKRIIES